MLKKKRTIACIQNNNNDKINSNFNDYYDNDDNTNTRPTTTPSKIFINNTSTQQNVGIDRIIHTYDIDPYDCSNDFLINRAIDMFMHYNLLTIYGIEQTTLHSFIHKVNELYLSDNYFHNFKHAWSVLHASFQILTHGADKLLEPLDILAVLISSLCHDLRHPGNNNAFELATNSTLSELYNSISSVGSRPILEHHHVTVTLNLLNTTISDYDILKNLRRSDKEHLFREVRIIILGTDMAKHNSIVNELKSYGINFRTTRSNSRKFNETVLIHKIDVRRRSFIKNSKQVKKLSNMATMVVDKSKIEHDNTTTDIPPPSLNVESDALGNSIDSEPHPIKPGVFIKSDPESRIIFTRALVHTADLGAQTQPLPIALKWMNRCLNEFRSQALKEQDLGIITSPYYHDIKEDCKDYLSQYYFIDEFVEPLWLAMIKLLPDLKFALDQLVKNKSSYKGLHENKTVSTFE